MAPELPPPALNLTLPSPSKHDQPTDPPPDDSPSAQPTSPPKPITTAKGFAEKLHAYREALSEVGLKYRSMFDVVAAMADDIYFKHGNLEYRIGSADLSDLVSSVERTTTKGSATSLRTVYYFLHKLGLMYFVKRGELVANMNPLRFMQAITVSPGYSLDDKASYETALDLRNSRAAVKREDGNRQLATKNLKGAELHDYFRRTVDQLIESGRTERESKPLNRTRRINLALAVYRLDVKTDPKVELEAVAHRFGVDPAELRSALEAAEPSLP